MGGAAAHNRVSIVRNEDGPVGDEFDTVVESLMTKFVPTGAFKDPGYRVLSLATMTAALYVSSDPFDLDYLSRSTNSADSKRA